MIKACVRMHMLTRQFVPDARAPLGKEGPRATLVLLVVVQGHVLGARLVVGVVLVNH